jgi:flagellar biosynthesis GTPase FlhF
MGIYNIPRQGFVGTKSNIKRGTKIWDPIETLNIINPDRGCLTCVGYAPSCRRRCRNPVNAGNRTSAFAVLDEMAYLEPESDKVYDLLYELAGYTLCLSYHQNQVGSMAKKWERQIEDTVLPTKIKIEDPEYIDFMNTLKETIAQLQADLKKEKARAERDRAKRDRAERDRAERDRAERDRAEKDKEERASAQREEKRRERAGREKAEREKEQHQKKTEEAERKLREEKERKTRDTKEKREQDRNLREEQERQKKQREVSEWQNAWNTYVSQWNGLGSRFYSFKCFEQPHY